MQEYNHKSLILKWNLTYFDTYRSLCVKFIWASDVWWICCKYKGWALEEHHQGKSCFTNPPAWLWKPDLSFTWQLRNLLLEKTDWNLNMCQQTLWGNSRDEMRHDLKVPSATGPGPPSPWPKHTRCRLLKDCHEMECLSVPAWRTMKQEFEEALISFKNSKLELWVEQNISELASQEEITVIIFCDCLDQKTFRGESAWLEFDRCRHEDMFMDNHTAALSHSDCLYCGITSAGFTYSALWMTGSQEFWKNACM